MTGLSVAGTFEYEVFQGGVTEHTPRASVRVLSTVPISEVAQVSVDAYYVPAIPDIADTHVYAQLSFETLFWKKLLGLKLTGLDEYDSRPRPTIHRNDTVFLVSFMCHAGE